MRVIARFSAGIFLVVLTIACRDRISPPTAPTQTSTTPTQPPTAPAQTAGAPTVLTGPYIVEGVVSEDGRPIAGANVSAWIDQGRSGYSYMWAHGPLLTDAAGRYQLTGLPAQVKVWLQTWKAGYLQQCAAPQVTLMSNTRLDVQLVAQANVSASTAPPSAPGFRSVSGVISEVTAAGKHPVGGAFVDFEPLMDFVAAKTVSDADGRYLLCGLPEGQVIEGIGVASGGRVASVSVPAGQNTGIDITLP